MTTSALGRLLARWRGNRSKFRAALVMEDGRRYGDAMADFQRADFAAADVHPGRHLYWERPRGSSKTTDLAALIVEELSLRPGARIYAGAADQAQAGLLHQAVAGWMTRTPGLAEAARVEKWTVAVPALDSRLEVLPADAPSTFGLSPTMIALDELAEWPEGSGSAFWFALWSAAPKKQARVCIISSPGMGQSGFAWQVREMARKSDRWLFSQQTQPAPWISEAWVEEQRESLPTEIFQRLWGGAWAHPGASFLLPAEVNAVFRPHPVLPAAGVVAVGGDLGIRRDATALVAVAMEGRGRMFTVLDVQTFRAQRGQAVDLVAVRDTLRDLMRRHRTGATLDPYQGMLMADELRREGFPVATYDFTHESRWRLFADLLKLVRAGRLQSAPHEELRSELLNLVVTQTPSGAARIDHAYGRHDDHVVATALAIHSLYEFARDAQVVAWLPNDKNDRGYFDPLEERPLTLQQHMQALEEEMMR